MIGQVEGIHDDQNLVYVNEKEKHKRCQKISLTTPNNNEEIFMKYFMHINYDY